MRFRTLALCSLAIAATWVGSDSASALTIGPVSVPAPPPVTVTVPPTVTVGPVDVPVSQVAPGLGASVTVSPNGGVAASVSLPSSVGPVPVLPGAPHDVQVALGPSDTGLTTPAAPPSAAVPVAGSRSDAQSPAPRRGTASGTRARAQGALAPSAARSQHESTQRLVPRVSHPPALPVESQDGVVNASLRQPAPGGPWSLFRDLASAHGLWLALLLIVAAGHFAAGGLLRDALRRRARVSST
jgi:hypothetical protein